VVVALGIGALAVIFVSRRRRAAKEGARRKTHETTRGRFVEARERQRRHDTDNTELMSDKLKAEAESTQVATQEATERVQQRGKEKATEENTEEEEKRKVTASIRLRSISGQPLMSIIRESARRTRRGG
jgi:hypothetical protein